MKRRETKKHDKKRRQELSRLEKKERLERVLAALGLLRGFRELPGAVHALAIERLLPRPKVDLSPAAHCSPALPELKKKIEKALAEATVSASDGAALPLLDVLSVGVRLPAGFSSLRSAPLSPKQRAFAEHAAKVSAAFRSAIGPAAVNLLTAEVMLPLVDQSRIDGQVVGCLLERAGSGRRAAIRLVLCCSEPR
jgi:hypothetical protein